LRSIVLHQPDGGSPAHASEHPSRAELQLRTTATNALRIFSFRAAWQVPSPSACRNGDVTRVYFARVSATIGATAGHLRSDPEQRRRRRRTRRDARARGPRSPSRPSPLCAPCGGCERRRPSADWRASPRRSARAGAPPRRRRPLPTLPRRLEDEHADPRASEGHEIANGRTNTISSAGTSGDRSCT